MEATAGVLIAITSPLVRLRVRHVLLQDIRIRVLGEVTDGPQLADRVAAQQPQVIVCDDRMLSDPHLETLFASPRTPPSYRVVVVAANTRTINMLGAVRVAAVLPIDLPADEMVLEVLEAVHAPEPLPHAEAPAPRLSALQHRFVSADGVPPSDGVGKQTSRLTAGHAPTASSATPLTLETQRASAAGRRKLEEGQQRLTAVLQAIKSEQTLLRDTITGLANTRALGNALRALPTINHPAAVVVVDLWQAGDDAIDLDLEARYSILRTAGALLRVNSRQDDLVCRLDGMTFAIVMPGLDNVTSETPMRRLRNALSSLSQPAEDRPFPLVMAMGIGFWEPGQPPAWPLERAWQAMVAERDGRREG